MIVKPGKFCGQIAIPSSKSDSQRAILLAGLTRGKSIIHNVGESEDEHQMIKNIRFLGAQTELNERQVSIVGSEIFPSTGDFNLGESGLGFRLMAGQFIVHGGQFVLRGSGTLQQRSIAFYKNELAQEGLKFLDNDGKPPLQIEGRVKGSLFEIDGSQGSQYLSGLLMALPFRKERSEVLVKNLKSKPYVSMTIDTMRKFGVKVRQAEFESFIIEADQNYVATEYSVENDWSSASAWIVASALGQKITLKGMDLNSLQADLMILKALEKSGCTIELNAGFISINGKNRCPLNFDANDCPDLFPALAAYSALTPGISSIKGLNRLKNKESDRGKTIQSELEKCGIKVDLDYHADQMCIQGGKSINGTSVNSHGDHRIAMMLAVLGMFSEGEMRIQGADAVSKSYPQFWEHMNGLNYTE
jgi:3-phosphoshikimate 1-carboxyvinyltransferase